MSRMFTHLMIGGLLLAAIASMAVGRAIELPRDRFVDVSREGDDLFTSSIAYGFDALRREGSVGPGDLGLIVSVAAGIEVGCALYHF